MLGWRSESSGTNWELANGSFACGAEEDLIPYWFTHVTIVTHQQISFWLTYHDLLFDYGISHFGSDGDWLQKRAAYTTTRVVIVNSDREIVYTGGKGVEWKNLVELWDMMRF